MAKRPSLTEKFGKFFGPEVQRAAAGLSVAPEITSPDVFSAEVADGEEIWWVVLDVTNRRLVLFCDCLEGEGGGLCAHMWAALVKAEEFGDLGNARKRTVSGKEVIVDIDEEEEEWDDDDDFDDFDDWEDEEEPVPRSQTRQQIERLEAELEKLRDGLFGGMGLDAEPSPAPVDVHFLVSPVPMPRGRKVSVRLYWASRDAALSWDEGHVYDASEEAGLYGGDLYDVLALLRPFAKCDRASFGKAGSKWYELEGGVGRTAVRRMGLTGRLHLESDDGVSLVAWDDAIPWDFVPVLTPFGDGYELSGRFRSSSGCVELCHVCVLGDGFALASGRGFAVELGGVAGRVRKLFAAGGSCQLTEPEARQWVMDNCLAAGLSVEGVDQQLVPEIKEGTPVPQVHVRTAKFKYRGREQLHVDLSFAYGQEVVREGEAKQYLRSASRGEAVQRNSQGEAACTDVLALLGCRLNENAAKEELGWKLHPRELDRVVWELVERDWLVTAEGKTYRKPQEKSLVVSSGMDWLEVRGGVEFDGEEVPLPKLLAAVKRGASAVRLDDGTYGLLPREWLEKFTVLTDLGEVVDDAVRFRLEQTMLLEALLRDRGIEAEEALAQSREALASFAGAGPADAPKSFVGTLRGYQRDGLGWLLALRDVGLGGCLADDMGLGKTVQVLSLLATEAERGKGLSLVVAPKSLVFNWESEAARFAPKLRTRTHIGGGRARTPSDLRDVDLLLTTYGTLRQDVEMLAEVPFHYAILDESQAIKNEDTSTAKCARALRARHRLAMTGTPVENRLQDLFSQFQFLNPGLFGSDRFLKQIAGSDANSTKTAATVGKALRPLILRRTKAQVVKELPPKTEQTVFCELGPEQRREYDRLRDFYREELTNEGQAGQMDVLSALLRLRQVACHAGLVSGVGDEIPSAKLDVLFEELETLREEGRKALVFSQFTMLLQRVKSELQARGVEHCYLDGKTKDRGAEVERFQTDDGIGVFLISLKAGGVGLNLTAADTVFLLDPWWNPAAESQAIDRTYRIGQDRPVFAYRLIARDTVEEKVLALQSKKRQIAKAAVGDEQGVVAALSFDDLCALLS